MSETSMKFGSLEVEIERELCIGSAACVKVAPEVLELDDEQVVRFTEGAGEAKATREQLLEACSVCPVEALYAYDEDGEQLAP